ncbi:MAG: hypothetical protein NTW87_22805 [Planctomycetota bacterium]|nr:hypothetical protein [Planctomycetota bacterium]
MKRLLGSVILVVAASAGHAEVCNLKVVTDASPDYSDLPSMIHSITAKWPAPQEKCWAMFYWNHIARRQTQPIELHGMALTDPIRQFNDYGYTMCSTISGINCGIWYNMGLKPKYWDISMHTVCEVEYDGRFHMYDNSLSAIYTLCDGKTIAGVEDIGKPGACEASGGKTEPGHVARYHCLCATSPRGFLIGADTARSLDEEYGCFNPKGLKYRYYFFDWDWGHRYILNLKDGEVYTRHYKSLGAGPEFYVPNLGKDPEAPNPRYRIRGNGVWQFKPSLAAADFKSALHSAVNIAPADPRGLQPEKTGAPAEAVFKVQSANVTTSQKIDALVFCKSADDSAKVSISTSNGLHWKEVWKSAGTGELPVKVSLVQEVNGAYEILIKVELSAKAAAADAQLKSLEVMTTTVLNSKTQPRLSLGKNTVYVGAGDQTESIVFWPELHGGKYKELIAEEQNIACVKQHIGYQGAVHPAKANEDAWLVYRIDAPADIVRLTYGGRFYNRAPKSHIDMLHSFDAGKTWTKSWTLTEIKPPWDVIHYETVEAPKGTRSVLMKYLMNTTEASPSGCSIYAFRMEANYAPADTTFKPLEVTLNWSEPQKDRSLVERSCTQLIEKLPCRFTVNVGGEDHPVMNSLTVNRKGARGELKYGYSDGKDAGGEKFGGKWVTYGKNIAVGKSYTLSRPSGNNWDAGDPDGKKLTDGVAGPPYAGGTSYRSGAIWDGNVNPVITLDLGAPAACASFGMNVHGYPFYDVLKGEVKDKVEVLVSDDGKAFTSAGFLVTDWRWKDLPANHIWPDEETITGATFRLIPEKPVTTRFIQYKVTSPRFFCCTELEVLDAIKYEPFDLRVALPDEK